MGSRIPNSIFLKMAQIKHTMKLYLSTILIIALFDSCQTDDKITQLLKRESPELEFIYYTNDPYRGNFINVIKGNGNSKVHYNIEVDDNGRVFHVNKYDNKYFEQQLENLDMYRSLQILISDTPKNDPMFFGHPVNGYYANTFVVNNVILRPNPKTNLTPLSTAEINLFKRIDSVAKVNIIKYRGFDTSKVIGWFKYVF